MSKHATFCGVALLAFTFASSAVAEGPDASTVVATVGGVEITLGEMIITRAQLPQQYQALPDDVLFGGILDQLVQQQVLANSVSEEPLRVQLSMKNERRTLMAGEVINDLTNSTVTEDAIKAAYDARYADAEPETEYNASHLLVATEQEAIDAKARIDGGEAFADVARELSSDSSAANGGNLGWFPKGAMVAPFEDAVIALEPGQISDPVQSDFGWHVINLLETRNAEKPSLDDVRGEISQEIQAEAITARIEELTAATEVTMPEDGAFDPALLSDLTLLDK